MRSDQRQQAREIVRNIVTRELPAAVAEFEAAGYGLDAYPMALGWVCGRYKLPAEFAPKVDELRSHEVGR